jgi:outer membrane protein assembly complex protein YaeT
VNITLNIEEGRQYKINEVTFSGDIIPGLATELEGIKKDLLGKPYYTRRKLLLWSRVKEVYDNTGYADSDIDIRTVQPENSGKVILEVFITSGKQVRISGVVISGNDRTRDTFIRNRLLLQKGDIYSNEKKRESFRKLFDTGLFTKIDIGLSAPLKNAGRNLEVKVDELPSRELYLEPGWGSYEKIRLRAGAVEKNLFGTGRNGRIDGLISAKGETLTLSYTDPWLLRTDISLSVPLSYERREEPSYTSKEMELSFLFSKKLRDSLTLSAGYSFSNTVTSDLTDQELIISGDDNYNKGTVSTQAVWDTRDNIFYPTKGGRLAAGIDLSLPALGSDLDFGRFTFGCRYFTELPKTFVLGLRATTGLIIPLQNQTFIPAGERFFNGGDNTVRSYEHSELGPKNNDGKPTGGLAYTVLSIELRRRFYQKFVASLYVDAGNISPNASLLARDFAPYDNRADLLDDTLNDFWREFKFGVGFGLMYLLPVGPARIDIAYNPAPEKTWNEDSWVLHFSLGLAF